MSIGESQMTIEQLTASDMHMQDPIYFHILYERLEITVASILNHFKRYLISFDFLHLSGQQ